MDTWGISGPTFLAAYGALLAVTAAAVLASRLREDAARKTGSADDLGSASGDGGLDDYEIAVLNGGSALAVAIALMALDRAGAVELGDRLVRELAATQGIDLGSVSEGTLTDHGIGMAVVLAGDLPERAHPVEADVYASVVASSGREVADIQRIASEMPAVAAVRSRLVARGLLRGPAEGHRRRREWLWFTPVLLLGAARLAYGLSRGKPVLYLVLAVGVAAGASALTATWGVGPRTGAGDHILKEMGRDPGDRDGAGRRLALKGPDELVAADPALALAVGFSVADATRPDRHWGGGWFGVGCGGGGDGGGGGGGGCGGGGCGGGGCGG